MGKSTPKAHRDYVGLEELEIDNLADVVDGERRLRDLDLDSSQVFGAAAEAVSYHLEAYLGTGDLVEWAPGMLEDLATAISRKIQRCGHRYEVEINLKPLKRKKKANALRSEIRGMEAAREIMHQLADQCVDSRELWASLGALACGLLGGGYNIQRKEDLEKAHAWLSVVLEGLMHDADGHLSITLASREARKSKRF